MRKRLNKESAVDRGSRRNRQKSVLNGQGLTHRGGLAVHEEKATSLCLEGRLSQGSALRFEELSA